jgi:hypothetical protein
MGGCCSAKAWHYVNAIVLISDNVFRALVGIIGMICGSVYFHSCSDFMMTAWMLVSSIAFLLATLPAIFEIAKACREISSPANVEAAIKLEKSRIAKQNSALDGEEIGAQDSQELASQDKSVVAEAAAAKEQIALLGSTIWFGHGVEFALFMWGLTWYLAYPFVNECDPNTKPVFWLIMGTLLWNIIVSIFRIIQDCIILFQHRSKIAIVSSSKNSKSKGGCCAC